MSKSMHFENAGEIIEQRQKDLGADSLGVPCRICCDESLYVCFDCGRHICYWCGTVTVWPTVGQTILCDDCKLEYAHDDCDSSCWCEGKGYRGGMTAAT